MAQVMAAILLTVVCVSCGAGGSCRSPGEACQGGKGVCLQVEATATLECLRPCGPSGCALDEVCVNVDRNADSVPVCYRVK